MDDELDEMIAEYSDEIDSSVRTYFANIPTSHDHLEHQGRWGKSTAHLVIPGPWHRSEIFWMDVSSGECFRVDADTDLLSPQELHDHEQLVKDADFAEISNFVSHDVFKLSLIHI